MQKTTQGKDLQSQENENQIRKSKYKSCERCRKYKRKCDRKKPHCSNCESLFTSPSSKYYGKYFPCIYAYRPDKKNSPKKVIQKPDISRLTFDKKKPNVSKNPDDDIYANINQGNIFSTIIDIPNQDLLGDPTVLFPIPSIPFESISSDILTREGNLNSFILNTKSILSSSSPFSDSSIPLTSSALEPFTDISNVDSKIPHFKSNITQTGNISLPPSFPVSIDDSWGSQSNADNDELSQVRNIFYILDSLEELKEQNLIAQSQNDIHPSYDLNIPAEYLSFHNPMLSIPSPSQLDFDIFTPTFADPTECRSFTFLLRDPNPVIPFKLKDHLISCFFTHYHRHHPILLLPDFFELCYPVCRHPSYLMNAIYAFGSIYSRHPVILNGETSRTITTTTLGNSFARVASKQLREVVIDDLDDNERPNYIIACILLSIYQMGMNFDQKRDHFSVFGLGMDTLKQFDYFYSFIPPAFPDQLLYPPFFRKMQQNDAIWEMLFGLDTMSSLVGQKPLFIDESKYPTLARIRLPSSRRHNCNRNTFGHSFPLCHDDPLPSSDQIPSTSSSSSYYYDSPYSSSSSSQSSWKTVLGGGLNQTITRSIPPSSSLHHLFPARGSRCACIRLFYISRKIIRWRKDSSHQDQNQKVLSLPKLNALMGHSITRHYLHDAIVEWYETLEPEWRFIPHLSDWLKYIQQPGNGPEVPCKRNLEYKCVYLTILMWFAISLIHANSNDDNELFSMPIINETDLEGSSSRFSNTTSSSSLKFVFAGTSATWCILSFRSLVRLISELSMNGEHPSIYGLTVPYAFHTGLTSLLREQEQRSSTTMFHDESTSNSYSQHEKRTVLSIVKGITVEEIVNAVQYQIIPFITETANIWVMGSIWIDLMNQFIEKIKNIH